MTAVPTTDPRPLTGEPLALDLVNTRWMPNGEPADLFAGAFGLSRLEGLGLWLESTGLAPASAPTSRPWSTC